MFVLRFGSTCPLRRNCSCVRIGPSERVSALIPESPRTGADQGRSAIRLDPRRSAIGGFTIPRPVAPALDPSLASHSASARPSETGSSLRPAGQDHRGPAQLHPHRRFGPDPSALPLRRGHQEYARGFSADDKFAQESCSALKSLCSISTPPGKQRALSPRSSLYRPSSIG
jgi:hypothetical protein